MLRGFWAVVDMAFRLFLRDRTSLFWGIAFPLIMMGLIGSVFGGTMNLVMTTSVVVDGGHPLNDEFTAALRSVPAFTVIEEDEATALNALRRGDRSLVVILPDATETTSYLAEMVSPTPPTRPPLVVRVYYDETSMDVAQAGMAIVNQLVDGFNRQLVPRVDLMAVESSGIAGEQFSMFDFLLPGMLAMVLMQTGLMGVTAVITGYREKLLLKRVLATPFPPMAFLTGLVARFTVTNLLQGTIIVLVGVTVFKAKIVGSYAHLFLLSMLGSITFLSVGFAVSAMSRSPDGANAFGSALAFPMMFLSGTFWPREFIPAALQPVIGALPLTPLVEALRGVATQGDGLGAHLGGMGYLAVWAVVSLIVAARRFRWD